MTVSVCCGSDEFITSCLDVKTFKVVIELDVGTLLCTEMVQLHERDA